MNESPGERAYRAPRALVPDATTEAEIKAGRSPCNQVILQEPDGRFQAMMVRDGSAPRFRFDPTPFASKEEGGLEAQRADVLGRPARVQATEQMLRGGR